MAHRHSVQAKATGGAAKKNVGGAAVAYGNPRVIKEAKEKKRGGSAFKYGGQVAGKKGKHRLAKYARGGKAGSDKAPFSSAHVAAPPAMNPGAHKSSPGPVSKGYKQGGAVGNFKRGGKAKSGYYAYGGKAEYGKYAYGGKAKKGLDARHAEYAKGGTVDAGK